MSPLSLKMTLKKIIEDLLQKAIEEKPHLFVVDFQVSSNSNVSIIIDGDNGVTLQDCIDINRAIENNIDQEAFDFSLEVASSGATTPIKKFRQLNKNIGRTLSITKLDNEKFEAELKGLNNENLVLEWQAREPKKIGKGKETVTKSIEIPYSELKEIIVKITFN
jgi:ribosome maturation factor RimP